MATRINRAIELLEADQAIYYTGGHTGHVLTYDQGKADAHTWADYINVGMEHGAFDMTGLAHYMQGLVDGGPTNSGHRTPTVVVEAVVNGTDEANVRFSSWQFRQILARGVHGILLCQAETEGAVRAFVEACRYPIHLQGVDPMLPSPLARLGGSPSIHVARDSAEGKPYLRVGLRGKGSEPSAAPVWGLTGDEYVQRADPWPLNPNGELLLGVKLESPEGVANCERILDVPGIGFAEMGPGDLSLSLGYPRMPAHPLPPEMAAARERIFKACRERNIPFLESATAETIGARIDEGVRVIAGGREEVARVGRAHSKRAMPV